MHATHNWPITTTPCSLLGDKDKRHLFVKTIKTSGQCETTHTDTYRLFVEPRLIFGGSC